MAEMFLYNGVKLPDIDTVWTGEVKKTYPYAYMVSDVDQTLFYLYVSSYPARFENGLWFAGSTTIKQWSLMDGIWGNESNYSQSVDGVRYAETWLNHYPIFWSSYNIVYQGTDDIYFPASPSPVSNVKPLNPHSLILGYLAGQKVRQLRSKLANASKTLTFSQLWGEVDPKTATLTMGELDSLDQEYLPYGIVGSNNTVTLKGKTLIVEGELDDDQREDTEEASE